MTGTQEIPVCVMSLSETGAFLYSVHLDRVGTNASLSFDLGGRRVSATVEVIFQGFQEGMRGMGVRFREFSGEDQDILLRWVQEQRDASGVARFR